MKVPTLSFCITCKNRFHQISKTLEKNLDDNRMHAEWIEFVLVDFGSTDGLKEWVLKNFSKDIEQGYLRYYYTEKLKNWDASIAKNTAHKLANNEIVVNLDCDNFTGYLGGQFIIRQFILYKNIVLHQFKGDPTDGSFGRIAAMKEDFTLVGGYDESFEPMAYGDTDLLNRLKSLGLKYLNKSLDKYIHTIKNSKQDSVANTNSKYNYEDMFEINKLKFLNNSQNGYAVANNGIFGITEGLHKYSDINKMNI